MNLALIATGFVIVTAGGVLIRSHDRAGRIVMVGGATLMAIGTIWLGLTPLFQVIVQLM